MKYVLVLLLLSLAIACDDGQSDTSAPQDPAKQLVADDASGDAADKSDDKDADSPSVGGTASFAFSTGDAFTGTLDLGNTTVGKPDNGNDFSGAIAAGQIFSGKPMIASASGAAGVTAEQVKTGLDALCLKTDYPAQGGTVEGDCDSITISMQAGPVTVTQTVEKKGDKIVISANGNKTCEITAEEMRSGSVACN